MRDSIEGRSQQTSCLQKVIAMKTMEIEKNRRNRRQIWHQSMRRNSTQSTNRSTLMRMQFVANSPSMFRHSRPPTCIRFVYVQRFANTWKMARSMAITSFARLLRGLQHFATSRTANSFECVGRFTEKFVTATMHDVKHCVLRMMEHYTEELRIRWGTSCPVSGFPRWRSLFVATLRNVQLVSVMLEQAQFHNSRIMHIRSRTSLRIGTSISQDHSQRTCLATNTFALASRPLPAGLRFGRLLRIQQPMQQTFYITISYAVLCLKKINNKTMDNI